MFAAYVAARAAWDLAARSEPDESVPGIVLAALSLLVVSVLAVREGREAWRGETCCDAC